jgi:hypothetical protein
MLKPEKHLLESSIVMVHVGFHLISSKASSSLLMGPHLLELFVEEMYLG